MQYAALRHIYPIIICNEMYLHIVYLSERSRPVAVTARVATRSGRASRVPQSRPFVSAPLRLADADPALWNFQDAGAGRLCIAAQFGQHGVELLLAGIGQETGQTLID